MIKFKHCCHLNNSDYIEAEATTLHEQNKRFVKLTVFDSEINTEINLYLDERTAIRLSKTIRTEINKIK
jgi:hypothetical protein